MSERGDSLARWDYPPVLGAAGTVSDLRLRVRGGQLTVLVLGYDFGPGASPGHQTTFYYLEQSSVPVPQR